MIPLACLATILIHTGYELAKPALFAAMAREGIVTVSCRSRRRLPACWRRTCRLASARHRGERAACDPREPFTHVHADATRRSLFCWCCARTRGAYRSRCSRTVSHRFQIARPC
ncbi:exported hypothetical protein [Paraburkholderia piptadeniae]|uniref:Uncharacterized protein n=1 Tax=Paraburkholderia piptadeniae TaxID=1701573 RepID=A0A1N7SQT9_9BURK|nr:exported hypothetical protein [Paraburkholderia piptadeniae]